MDNDGFSVADLGEEGSREDEEEAELGLSLKPEKKEVGIEGRRWDGELSDGKAFCNLLKASCPVDLDLERD